MQTAKNVSLPKKLHLPVRFLIIFAFYLYVTQPSTLHFKQLMPLIEKPENSFDGLKDIGTKIVGASFLLTAKSAMESTEYIGSKWCQAFSAPFDPGSEFLKLE